MDQVTTPVITIDRQYFYQGEKRFIARGVVYQPNVSSKTRVIKPPQGNLDPLDDANYTQVLQDVLAFRELNINALWVYNHNPMAEHKMCMDLLANNGIYVIFETSNSRSAINRTNPDKSYTAGLLNHFNKVIDSVSRYCNTMGICVASQVVNQSNVEVYENIREAWDVLGHTVRDVKQYMRFKSFTSGQRILPVCISDGQWSSMHSDTFRYIADTNCEIGPIRPVGGRVDFYCFIHYGTSDDSTAIQIPDIVSEIQLRDGVVLPDAEIIAHASTLTAQRGCHWKVELPMRKFADMEHPIPIMISEYGANALQPRLFNEVAYLYGTNLDSPLLNTLSGGFAYEFLEGANKFGMVQREGGGGLQSLDDFFYFRARMRAALGETPSYPQGLIDS